ncbi:MAG: hypothetical protein EHM35_00665 [Planctomycetaceae bacterium]|nr:MAG: hypothetical protein EHM35_00665 [Planctomycetaceae bacterium]
MRTIAAANAYPDTKAAAYAVCDGVNDAQIINDVLAGLSLGGEIALSEGDFHLQASIQMQEKTALRAGQATRLFVKQNVHGVQLARYSMVSGGQLRYLVATDKAAIYLPCNPTVYAHTGYLTMVEKMWITAAGNDYTQGHGVFIDATMPEYCFATGVRFRDLYIYGFRDSIRIESAVGTENWINSNYFDNIYARASQYGVWCRGGHNVYTGFVYQSHPCSVRAIYTDGMDQFVGGRIWDWNQTGQAVAVECLHPNGPTRLDIAWAYGAAGPRSDRVVTSSGMTKVAGVTQNVVTTAQVGPNVLPDPRLEIGTFSGQAVLLTASVRLKSQNGGAPAMQLFRRLQGGAAWTPACAVIFGVPTVPGGHQTLVAASIDKPYSATWEYGISWGNIYQGTDTITAEGADRELTAVVLAA